MVRRSKLCRPFAAWRHVLSVGCVAGLTLQAAISSPSRPPATGASVSAQEAQKIREVAARQSQMLQDKEPELARRYGRGSPQYAAALHALLETHAKTALKPEPVPPSGAPTIKKRRAMAPSDVEAPVVFPIHQDPRTAQALEMQRLEMLPGTHPKRIACSRDGCTVPALR